MIQKNVSEPVSASVEPTNEPLLDAMLENSKLVDGRPASEQGLLIGTVVGFGEDGLPNINIPGHRQLHSVVSMCPVRDIQFGARCVISFCGSGSPVILGKLHPSAVSDISNSGPELDESDEPITIRSETEIKLECGDAQIRLTPDGRVEIRGRTVVSHSTGLNRIRGASIKLN